ncbi:TlpA disulfide reductase family protein [uncultured Algibacter sp.]|uniref:TlpA family protein disulfide reductase n=1 Tax=uncultured Algibacter sp. TaxID=298659 RepID=UPI00321753F1
MKKVIYILSIVIVFVSCKKEASKGYVTLSGTITNQNSDSLMIAQRAIIKTIKVNPDGTFSDTLKVETGNYMIFDGSKNAPIYLKNGYDLKMTIDAKKFNKTITFKGKGEDANNYIVKKALLIENAFDENNFKNLDQKGFDIKLKAVKTDFETLLINTKNLDTTFISDEQDQHKGIYQRIIANYKKNQDLLAMKGDKSPKFVDYENHAGGATSLEDLKGKYVYIDLWATWCGPCKTEIPYLKTLEKEYHGKNIEFVSISLDRQSAYNTWKTMVKEKELSGIQLYAKEDKTFSSGYKVADIPRFIVIDPNGNIVDADAPRPSDGDKLKNLFSTLNI